MKTLKVECTFLEEILGTANADPKIHETFIANNAPNAKSREEEIAALGVDEVIEKSMTVFPRQDGNPHLWDYQIKGFFKDACGMLARVKDNKKTGCVGTKSSKLTAYKKVIDGLIFPSPRIVLLQFPKDVDVQDRLYEVRDPKGETPEAVEVGTCQRPLRAQTAKGERIALASSETAPVGTKIVFNITMFDPGHEGLVREWLDYGAFRGLGQWRNSGKGRFAWKEV